jgi:hypothetical protein
MLTPQRFTRTLRALVPDLALEDNVGFLQLDCLSSADKLAVPVDDDVEGDEEDSEAEEDDLDEEEKEDEDEYEDDDVEDEDDDDVIIEDDEEEEEPEDDDEDEEEEDDTEDGEPGSGKKIMTVNTPGLSRYFPMVLGQ